MPETDPTITPICLKCGSDAIVPDVLFVEQSNDGGRRPVEVSVLRKPHAWLMKGEERQPTVARVCGDCGFVEVYATAPAVLWDAHIDRAANDLD